MKTVNLSYPSYCCTENNLYCTITTIAGRYIGLRWRLQILVLFSCSINLCWNNDPWNLSFVKGFVVIVRWGGSLWQKLSIYLTISFLSFIIRGFELLVLHSNIILIVCQPFGLSFLFVYPCPCSLLLFDSYLRLFNRSSISLSPHLHLTIGIHTRVLVDCW